MFVLNIRTQAYSTPWRMLIYHVMRRRRVSPFCINNTYCLLIGLQKQEVWWKAFRIASPTTNRKRCKWLPGSKCIRKIIIKIYNVCIQACEIQGFIKSKLELQIGILIARLQGPHSWTKKSGMLHVEQWHQPSFLLIVVRWFSRMLTNCRNASATRSRMSLLNDVVQTNNCKFHTMFLWLKQKDASEHILVIILCSY